MFSQSRFPVEFTDVIIDSSSTSRGTESQILALMWTRFFGAKRTAPQLQTDQHLGSMILSNRPNCVEASPLILAQGWDGSRTDCQEIFPSFMPLNRLWRPRNLRRIVSGLQRTGAFFGTQVMLRRFYRRSSSRSPPSPFQGLF